MIDKKIISYNKYTIEVAYISDKGGRMKNEDSIGIFGSGKFVPKVVCVVADGLGAHGGGDIASSIAVSMIEKDNKSMTAFSIRNINRLFAKINKKIVHSQTETVKMRTTIGGIFISNDKVFVANVGDTRVYWFDNNEITGITKDHTFAYKEVMENGGTLDDIRKNPNRHILMAAVGVDDLRPPDVYVNEIEDGQSYLICSDGFWEYVNEYIAVEALRNAENSMQWLDLMLKIHNKSADEWHDNYSALCIKIYKNK